MKSKINDSPPRSLSSKIILWWLVTALLLLLIGVFDIPSDLPASEYGPPGGRALVSGETVGKYHGGSASATGKGKFTVTGSDNSQIPMGTILATHGSSTEFRKKLDKELRSANIRFYVSVPDIKVVQPFWVMGHAVTPCFIPQQVGKDKYHQVLSQCRTQPGRFKVVPAALAEKHVQAKDAPMSIFAWAGFALISTWMLVWGVMWAVRVSRTK